MDKLECLLLRGFNGFDDYAAQFWIDHVLAYKKLTPVDARCAETTNQLRMFATAWRKSDFISLGKERNSLSMKEVSLHDVHPTIREIIEEVMSFRNQLKLREAASSSYDCEIYTSIDSDVAERSNSRNTMAN